MSLRWPFYPNGFLAQLACVWEATARKVGNVHRTRDFADTSYLDFVVSGCAIAPAIGKVDELGIGETIREGLTDSRHLVAANTNLGILLLLAPLAKAARLHPAGEATGPARFRCRPEMANELNRLTVRDARTVYECIRLAKPGGLGAAPDQDVRGEPTVTLLDAMRLAADRDMIARQYANGFADVFEFGVPTLFVALERYGCVEAAVVECQFRWLAEYHDSLIARKNGPAVAEDVRRRAAEVVRLGGVGTAEGRAAGVALDGFLRSDGNKLNPGTTADLIAACLFVALRENKVKPSAPFPWQVEDWL